MTRPKLSPEAESLAAQKIAAARAGIWKRSLPLLEERLAVLERAAATSPLPEDLRSAAHTISHQLSGSLGMFGYDRGTLIARELERLYEDPDPDPQLLATLTRELRDLIFPAP